MSPKSEREDILTALSSKVLLAMVDDLVFEAALQSHHEVLRNRTVCLVCETRCATDFAPMPSPSTTQAVIPPSRPTTPLGEPKAPNGTGTSTPTSVKADGFNNLECVNCNRPFSSNRYATHLSGCLGIGTGIRRGSARTPFAKPKNSSEGPNSPSASEAGNVSDDTRNSKEKGKSKNRRADDAEFITKRKRLESPQLTSGKKPRKPKAVGSPVARVKTENDASGIVSHKTTSPSSHLKAPSKLRASSTASLLERERSSSPGSRSSSPDTPVASLSTPTSSAVSAHSPALPNGNKRKPMNAKAKTFNSSPRLPSPPILPAPPVRIAEPDYLIDVEADETGSSTDTDSP